MTSAYKEALIKITRYCAYQERSYKEVREKLGSFELTEDEIDHAIFYLEDENYLDEPRFVEVYIRSKIRQNKWGKIKVKQHLKQKQIPDSLITGAFSKFDFEEYYSLLSELIIKKCKELSKEKDFLKKKAKLVRFAVGKGFESHLVYELVNINLRQEKK